MFFLRSSKQRQQLTDQELIDRFTKTGDGAFVAELFERYSMQIYTICRKYLKDEDEARDAAMEIFEYLLKEIPKYEIRAFKSWLARSTSNFCLMRLRKAKSVEAHVEAFKKNEADLMESEDGPHLDTELPPKEVELLQLEAAVLELRDEQKTCIQLFFLQGKSYEEVAALTGYSYNQVKSHIQNGKRNLKLRLSEGNG